MKTMINWIKKIINKIREEIKYRKRLKENYYKIKWYLRGEQIWDSMSKGTYLIKKHGNIK